MSTQRVVCASAIIGFAIGCFGASIFAQATRPAANEVVQVKLPLDLPAIGNIDGPETLPR